jgi:ribonuclease-3
MALMSPSQADTLTLRLGYAPRDRELFVVALTHRSADGPNNERLEFLGDSVLNLLLSERLYREFPSASEGDLSRLRARLVSEEPLAEVAHGLQLGELLSLGSGELKTGGFRRQSILADAFEALCGALYLDGGLDVIRDKVLPLFEPKIAALPEPATLKDAKTRLQEHLQADGRPLPVYNVKRTTGEPHAQVFLVSCVVPHRFVVLWVGPLGPGAPAGARPPRRRAEQVAAQAALQALGVPS